MTIPNEIDAYISSFPKETQAILELLRATIKKAAPQAQEIISYKMPAYNWEGNLVYFAAYKNHVGLYPTSSGIKAFENEISAYKWSKGAVQFPLNKPLPVALITKIVKFRLAENIKKMELKKDNRTKVKVGKS